MYIYIYIYICIYTYIYIYTNMLLKELRDAGFGPTPNSTFSAALAPSAA